MRRGVSKELNVRGAEASGKSWLELQADGFDRRLCKTTAAETRPNPIRASAKLDGSGAALPVVKPISVRCSKPKRELAPLNPAFAVVMRLL